MASFEEPAYPGNSRNMSYRWMASESEAATAGPVTTEPSGVSRTSGSSTTSRRIQCVDFTLAGRMVVATVRVYGTPRTDLEFEVSASRASASTAWEPMVSHICRLQFCPRTGCEILLTMITCAHSRTNPAADRFC